MKSKVYFIAVNAAETIPEVQKKCALLMDTSGLAACINKGDRTAVKLHFGEEGNTGFVRPDYVKVIIEQLIGLQASPFLSDTNTLYRGRRTNSIDHLKLAYEHGFLPQACGAEVIIPDDTKKENIEEIAINKNFIKTAKVAKIFLDADALVGVAHFKGHIMTGFGGALKNIGMGCAARGGKMAQHSDIAPFVTKKNCVGCGACVEVCPVNAIRLEDKKASVDSSLCIGCASCIAACSYYAIEINWEAGGNKIQEKMIEYAYAVLSGKMRKCFFVNFAIKITQECDCLAKDDPRICPDIGIFASTDPVAIDKACLDAVIKECGKDIFKQVHPKRDGLKQVRYAEELGLGNLEYELVDLSQKKVA